MTETAEQAKTPYDAIGGRETIARLVERFYDLMDSDTAYAELRAMHAPDLAPMRASLTDFLTAWSGGPRDWFEKRPGACIMSAHRSLVGMNRQSADQWIAAMESAARETMADVPEMAALMTEALGRMSRAMAGQAEAGQAEAGQAEAGQAEAGRNGANNA